jgi:hypothetical protein
MGFIESYDLEPRYSSNEISGRCVKCLAEQELNTCLMRLRNESGEEDREELKKKSEEIVR